MRLAALLLPSAMGPRPCWRPRTPADGRSLQASRRVLFNTQQFIHVGKSQSA